MEKHFKLNLTPELLKTRAILFAKLDAEDPPVSDFVLTSSGIVEPMPIKHEDWEQFKQNFKTRRDNEE